MLELKMNEFPKRAIGKLRGDSGQPESVGRQREHDQAAVGIQGAQPFGFAVAWQVRQRQQQAQDMCRTPEMLWQFEQGLTLHDRIIVGKSVESLDEQVSTAGFKVNVTQRSDTSTDHWLRIDKAILRVRRRALAPAENARILPAKPSPIENRPGR